MNELSEGELRAAAQEDALELSEVEQWEAVEDVTDVEMPCDAASGVMGWLTDPMSLPTPSEPVWVEATWCFC